MRKLALALLVLAAGTAGASAADLPARTYTKAPVAPIYNWTGVYVGLNAGGAWNDANATTTTLFPVASYFADSSVPAIAAAGNQNINRSGFTGGVTAGYNWQINQAVLGVEADFNYFGVKGSTSSTAFTRAAPRLPSRSIRRFPPTGWPRFADASVSSPPRPS